METMKTFTNGFESWQETHFEVANFLTSNQNKDLKELVERHGSTILYGISKSMTDDFEKLNEGREWDGEFFEEVWEFAKTELNKYL